MKVFDWIFGEKIKPGETKLKIPKAPHEIFPDILHWKTGDKLTNNGDRKHAMYIFDGVNESGTVFYHYFDGTKYTIHIMAAINHLINCSLINRDLSKKSESTKEYMQLMKDFQQAYREISDIGGG